MSRSNFVTAYLDLANRFYENEISECDLPIVTAQLPYLNEAILHKLASHAEGAGLSKPRFGWAITTIGDNAANSQNRNLFVRSMAAWYLGRACNDWARPKQVLSAIGRAREGFVELKEPGWIAACDWQLNALSWVKSDLLQAARILNQALEGLRNAHLNDFVPHCRLSFAYAQVLIGELDQAKENIQESEAAFSAQGDTLNQARCWRIEASYLRRLARFNEAIHRLENAMEIFISMNAPLDVGRVHYQLGLIHLLRTDDLAIALSHLNQAAHIFSQGDLDLWQAACTTNIGSIYTQYGDLAKADECLQEARAIFTEHDVLGLLADNLNDSGKLNTLRGFPKIAIDRFKQAERIYKDWGAPLPAAIQMANLGEVYGHIGRYQDALHHLERAADRLKLLNNPLRLGTCENYAALIWWRLGQPGLAHEYLDKATLHYQEANQIAYLSLVFNFRANLFFEQGELHKAIDCLKSSLELAEASGIRPHAALARRLLGEAHLRAGQHVEAKIYLERALSDFSEMEMSMEIAATLVSLGNYYVRVSNIDRARSAFKAALRTSRNSFPEIDWRAHVGQAGLAEIQGDTKAVFRNYHKGEKALSKVRFNFWQPGLVGSYLQSPSLVYDNAVISAYKANSSQDVLRFIENNKATTLLRKLTTSRDSAEDKSLQELNDLRAEINWLQEQLRASYDRRNLLLSSMRSHELHSHLVEKVKQYDMRMARLERQGISEQITNILALKFNLPSIKRWFTRSVGKSWVAVDYYLTEDQLIISILTPDSCLIQSNVISHRIKIALEECQKARQNATPLLKSDLRVLGDFLIPDSLSQILSPDAYLLISPHRVLHGLPWAAIQPSYFSKPLACVCIPNIVPSLHSLSLLCQRSFSNPKSKREQGLIIGMSEFRGVYQELPYVKDEIDTLQAKLDASGCALRDSEASWENLQKLVSSGDTSNPGGLKRFTWLHIASHVLSDVHTGRLSGIALWNGDIWLDQLLDLAPLPGLVTFSACNSIYSVIYQGDEHIGLPTTCLTAGAYSIVGSIRPIPDRLASEFMIDFYDHYMDGMRPSQAVVFTQRQMIANGEDAANWASFVSVGVP